MILGFSGGFLILDMLNTNIKAIYNKRSLQITIDTPKMSFVKYKDDGSVDYISPFPCPFNYGSAPNTISGDGDREDAIYLGKKIQKGHSVTVNVWGVVNFIDKGENDPKYICSEEPPTLFNRAVIRGFFLLFAVMKRGFNRIKRKKGKTELLSIKYF